MENTPRTGMTAEFTTYEIARFWQKVRVGAPDECWDWQACTREGYGAFRAQGKVYGAHRIAYELDNGPMPEGKIARHSCDRRICCNPAHIKPGTKLDNYRDMQQRGQPFNVGTWQHDHPERRQYGEAHKDARFTEVQVRMIRRRAALGVSRKALAREYGVSYSTIKDIVTWTTWRHMRDEHNVVLTEAA